jgi:hypothetical protein
MIGVDMGLRDVQQVTTAGDRSWQIIEVETPRSL